MLGVRARLGELRGTGTVNHCGSSYSQMRRCRAGLSPSGPARVRSVPRPRPSDVFPSVRSPRSLPSFFGVGGEGDQNESFSILKLEGFLRFLKFCSLSTCILPVTGCPGRRVGGNAGRERPCAHACSLAEATSPRAAPASRGRGPPADTS